MTLQVCEANPARLAYVGSQPGAGERQSNDWHTPRYLIDQARQVMGQIDLDPFSSAGANRTVRARYFFDVEHSAFDRPWLSRRRSVHYPFGVNVWMNPPYSAGLLCQAIDCLLEEGQRGHVAQAIVLVNNATETRWFQRLCDASSALCLLYGRVAFEATDGKVMSGNTRGQVLAYLPFHGDMTPRFLDEFNWMGLCLPLRKVA